MSYYSDSDDEVPTNLPSRRVRFHGHDEDADVSSSDRSSFSREADRRGTRPPSPPRSRIPRPATDTESVPEREAERARPVRRVSDSSTRDHSQERIRQPSRRASEPSPPHRRTSGYFSEYDVYEPSEGIYGSNAFVNGSRANVASPEFWSPTSPYDTFDERKASRPSASTTRDERFDGGSFVHGPHWPHRDRGHLRDRKDQLRERLALIYEEIDEIQQELRVERSARLGSEVRRAKDLLLRQKQLSSLLSAKDSCEDALEEHKEKAKSLEATKARLQRLALDEENLLRKQQQASDDSHNKTTDDDEALSREGAAEVQNFAGRLLDIRSEKAQAQDQLRSAQASTDLMRRLALDLHHLERDIKEARYREANARIAAQGAQDDDSHRVNNLDRCLELAMKEKQFLIQSLDVIEHRERLETEQDPYYLKPEQRTVIVRSRSRDRGAPLSSDGWTEEYVYPSGSDEPAPDSPARPRDESIIIQNRVYNDYSSEDETLASGSFVSDYARSRPWRTCKSVERDGLSVSFPLNKGPIPLYTQDLRGENAAPTPAAKAWKEDKTYLADDEGKSTITTELRVIHAAEYSEDELGIGKTILMCLDGPRAKEGSQSAQMRWLHVQQKNLKFKTLEGMVSDCFHLDNELKSVAVCAIAKVKDQFQGDSECGAYLAPGSILRYIGERPDAKDQTADKRYTEPVVFLSCPFLALQPFKSERGSNFEHRPRSLLQSLYGYDVGSERETGQVVQKLGISKSRKDVLHINQLWCLKMGPKILITMSEQSAAQLCGHDIVMNPRNSNMKEPLLVRLTDIGEREYRMVVERDCTYVDFLTLAVARVAGPDADASRWDIFDEGNHVLTPNRWIEILGSTENDMCSVSVVKRSVDDRDSDVTVRDTSVYYSRRSNRIRSSSRSASHARRAIRSASRSLSRRRTRSENDLRQRPRGSRSRSSYNDDVYSGMVVANRTRSAPRATVRSSLGPYTRASPSYLPSSHGPLVLAPRHKTRDSAYQHEPLNKDAGALVLYRRPARQHTGYTDEELSSSGRKTTLDVSATGTFPESSASQEHLPDSQPSIRFYARPEGLIEGPAGPIDDETSTILQEHNWGHRLSPITEERSSSAPTPKVGTSNEVADITSPGGDNANEDERDAAGVEMDPQNMQIIIRPKGLGFGDETFAAGQSASSKDSDIEIDISEPWRKVLSNTASGSDGPVHGFPGSSGLGLTSQSPEDFERSKDDLQQELPESSQRAAGGNHETIEESTRPIFASAETLRTAGADLHALYILLATALRLEDHARAAEVRYYRIPDQELLIKEILQEAVLPAEWETNRDLQAAARSIEEIRRRQEDPNAEGANEADASIAIIHQEKIVRRLQLIDKARNSVASSDVDLRVAEVRWELASLRSELRAAQSAGNFAKAANLTYSDIPMKQEELDDLIPKENRFLDWDDALNWAHGRGQFIWGFGPDHTLTGSQTAKPNLGVPDRESQQYAGSSQHYILQTNRDSLQNNEAFASWPGHAGQRGHGQYHEDYGSPYHHVSSPRYYGAPVRRPSASQSRSRRQRSPSISPESASQFSGSYLSDDATLAPGVILNEKPRASRPMSEVYDPDEVPRRSVPEDYSIDGELLEATSFNKSGPFDFGEEDTEEKVEVESHHTSKFSTLPTVTRVSLWTSADKARMFKRRILRRYAPADDEFSRIELAEGVAEMVDDEEADGPFDKGCRTFYRRKPKPAPGEEADWVDEYVLDFRNLPFLEHSMFTLPITWPPLPSASAEATKPRTSSLEPFLRWRVKTSEEHRTPEEIDKSVLKILKNVDESLQTGGFGDMYPDSFMCTLKELYERHEFLTSLPKHSPVLDEFPSEQGNGQKPPDEGPSEGLTSNNEESKGIYGPQSPPEETADTRTGGRRGSNGMDTSPEPNTEAGQRQSMDTHSHEQAVLKNLVDVSKALLAAYLPAEGSPLFNSVCQHFWGCIDEISRQVTWQMIQSSRGHRVVAYIIRDFDFPSNIIERAHQATNQKGSWSSCQHCKGGRHYATIRDALRHLHADHFDCSSNVKEPHDDPCFVWVRQLNGERLPSGVAHLHLAAVEDFVGHLLLISRYSKELHNLVASLHGSDTKLLPELPPHIVSALEQIMGMYMAMARRLSLNNLRASRSSAKPSFQKIDTLIDRARLRGEQARFAAMDRLTEAKKNILRGTTRQIDSLSVEAVGAEFLVLSLITNLQNRPALNKAGPHNPERVDFVELYRRYTSSLRFQANRRPKKRVFLDIHGLEEELDALHGMVTAQISLNSSYLRLLDPDSTLATNATRVGQFTVERAYVRKQQKNLDSRVDDIYALRGKAEVLKEQVKKTIEILEEDHGKAIRVFTFVTLLFLPLSFVTSFMGMNTTDIRDTEWSQRIFWATGLPVTIVVVILALIYAYRGERIQDWILTRMRSRKRRAGRDVGGSFAWSGEVPEGDTFLLRGGTRRAEAVRRGTVGSSFPPRREPAWMNVKERLRSKRKSRTAPGPGIRRRRTGESLARGTM